MSALILAAVATVGGCSAESRYRALSVLFDGVPAPGEEASPVPVVRRPRHPRQATPTPTPRRTDGATAPAALTTWDDVVRMLPKDPVGNPDWVVALEENMIAPRPAITPEREEPEIRLPDVAIVPPDPAFTVRFSHQKHGAWLRCSNCHTNLFAMQAGATPMTAAAVHGDRYCGACHGKVAFDMTTGCQLCHLRSLPKDADGRIDWSAALAAKLIAPRPGLSAHSPEQPVRDTNVEFKPALQPQFTSVFSHGSHTRWLACDNCHPALFPMQNADIVGADLHSRDYCGACHGSVAFGLTGSCARCHPALRVAKQHQEFLDLDVEIPATSGSSSRTTFSHKLHTPWVECSTCHSGLFEKTAAAKTMTMADIYTGKYCAVCHGNVAADLIGRCQSCHAGGDAR